MAIEEGRVGGLRARAGAETVGLCDPPGCLSCYCTGLEPGRTVEIDCANN